MSREAGLAMRQIVAGLLEVQLCRVASTPHLIVQQGIADGCSMVLSGLSPGRSLSVRLLVLLNQRKQACT